MPKQFGQGRSVGAASLRNNRGNTAHPEARDNRLKNVLNAQFETDEVDVKAEKGALRESLHKNLEAQKKLWQTYKADLMAVEVYKQECDKLRNEEKDLKKTIAKIDMKLVEKERSNDYVRILKRIIADFAQAKKELLQLIFKRIIVNDGKIESFELYKPFKRLYEEQKCKMKEKTAEKDDSYILQPTAVR